MGCVLGARVAAVPLAQLRSSRHGGSRSLPRGATRHRDDRAMGCSVSCPVRCVPTVPACTGRGDLPLCWRGKGRKVSGPGSLACREEMWAKSLH